MNRYQSSLARHNHARSILARRRGLTLIEVAIALVVFVIGALAIIQIFPPALGIIQNSESRTVASRMDDATLSRWHEQPDLVPYAIYNAVDGGTAFTSPGSTVTGTASMNDALPDDPRGFDTSALSKFKRIVGEGHSVLSGSGTDRFVLTQFPFEEGTLKMFIEEEINGVTVDTAGNLDFTNASTESVPLFRSSTVNQYNRPPTNARYDPNNTSNEDYTYYVSYRWKDNGSIKGVIDEPILFPADVGVSGTPTWSWDSNSSGKVAAGLRINTIGTNPVIPGPVAIRYRVEKAVATSTAGARRGYIPLPSYATGTPVSIDYTVRDWRWLVDERVLDRQPAPVPTTDPDHPYIAALTLPNYVRLPVGNLEKTPGSTPPIDVYGLIWNRNGSSTPTLESPQANLEDGVVYYEANGLASPLARTVYQTINEWTHQVSVAAKSYMPFYPVSDFTSVGGRPVTAPREPWREYFTDYDSVSGDTTLCFHAGEAGKTIAVSFMVNSTNTIISNKVLTIDAGLQASSAFGVPAGFDFGSNQIAVAKITLPSSISILSVRGIDVRSRTAWINGNNWTQTILTGYRTQ